MNDIWFISDTHFNHKNIILFKDDNGNSIRSNFSSVEEMNEVLIQNWNALVKPSDKIYHLGDVAFGNVSDMNSILSRLNGKKRLILGNHDRFDIHHYAKHFNKILSWRHFSDIGKRPFIACHYPLHAASLERGSNKDPLPCVHGHLHQRTVPLANNAKIPDSNYINVCVEKTDFRPINLDEIIAKIER